MLKVYDYDALDGDWSAVIAKQRKRYDVAGIKVETAVDGLYAERRLSEAAGFCGYCRKFFDYVEEHEREQHS